MGIGPRRAIANMLRSTLMVAAPDSGWISAFSFLGTLHAGSWPLALLHQLLWVPVFEAGP